MAKKAKKSPKGGSKAKATAKGKVGLLVHSLKPVAPQALSVKPSSEQFFAIMLDKYRKVHGEYFPLTAMAEAIDQLDQVGQHNGTYTLVPRTDWRADLRREKDLINAMTGKRDDGGIYHLVRS